MQVQCDEYSPPWIRRGGCAIMNISRSNNSSRRRGGWFKPPIIDSWTNPLHTVALRFVCLL